MYVYMYTQIAVVFHHYSVRNNIFLTFFCTAKSSEAVGNGGRQLLTNLNVFSFFDKYKLYPDDVQIQCNENMTSIFIQIAGLHKGQIKKHFLIKVQEIAKEKEGSALAIDLGFLFNKN